MDNASYPKKIYNAIAQVFLLIADFIEDLIILFSKEVRWRHFYVWTFHENRVLVMICIIVLSIIAGVIAFIVKMTPFLQLGNVILQIATVLVSAAMYNQVIQSRRQKKVDLMDTLYKKDLEERKDISTVTDKFKVLANEYSSAKAFEGIFNSKDFDILRTYTYHYEYMGQMLYRRKLDFNVLFDSVSYPAVFENLWNEDSEEYQVIQKIRENEVADLWNGIEFLYRMYAYKRLENNLDSLLMYDHDCSKISDCRKKSAKARKKLRKFYFRMPF